MTEPLNVTTLKVLINRYRVDLAGLGEALSAIDSAYRNEPLPDDVAAAWEALNAEWGTTKTIIAGLEQAARHATQGATIG